MRYIAQTSAFRSRGTGHTSRAGVVGFGANITKVADRGSGSAVKPSGTGWTFGHGVLTTESASRLFSSGSTGAAGSHGKELEYGGVFFVW